MNTRFTNKTTARVTWGMPVISPETPYTSPDISSIIQEVIGLSGWASGNYITLLLADNGTNASGVYRQPQTYDHTGTLHPLLSVTYHTTGATIYYASSATA